MECEAQSLLDKRISVRFGQLAADSDFLIDKGASSFLETSWPALLAQDLPSGGPTYPLAATGVRVAITPNDRLGFMIAVFNGDPAGPHCTGDPQLCNNNGLDFRFDSPPLLMAEGSYKYKQDELAGTIKLGGWNHFALPARLTKGPAWLGADALALYCTSVCRRQLGTQKQSRRLYRRIR